MLYFLVEVAGLGPGLAGVVLLVGRVLDALVDPVLGQLSDAVKARRGRRSPLIFWGAVPFGLSFALLWWLPEASAGVIFGLAAAALIVHACVFTLVQTSYLALTPELAPDYGARTVLSGYRVVFATVASLLAAAAPPLLAAQLNALAGVADDARLGWRVMGVLFGLVMSGSYLVMVKTVREPLRRAPVAPTKFGPATFWPTAFWHSARATLKARGFPALLGLFVLVTLGLGTVSSILPFFLSSRLQLPPALQTALLALLFVAAALSVPLWTRLSQQLGKTRTFALGLLLLTLSLPLLVGFSRPGELSLPLLFSTLLAGAGVGSVLLFPWALLPDVTEHDAQRSAVRRDGLFYALFTLCQTAAFALSAALGGGVLELSGYSADAALQTARAAAGVSWLVGGVAPGFFLLALWPLSRYRLERSTELHR